MKTLADYVAAAKAVVEDVPPATVLSEGHLLLDVREAAELGAEGTLEGALHVPRGLLEAKADPASPVRDERLVAALEAGETIDVFCAVGARGALAAKTLGEMGYRARNVEGGMKAWKEAGLPVVADR